MAQRRHTDSRLSPFGARLRQWRHRRGLSQLDLALSAGTTPRHVSFLETGRSRPSREMVLRIGDALEISLRERNRLLESAGLSAVYRELPLDAEELAPFQQTIDRLLQAHEPYPAMAGDGHWNVVAANRASASLFGDGLPGSNMIRRLYGDPHLRETVVNLPDVAWAGLLRLRRQQREAPLDAELAALVEVAEEAVAGIPRPEAPADELVVCPHFRVGEQIIRTMTMVARFDTALELTLDELRIELTYPQDEVAERFFRQQALRASASREGAPS